ncbi:MAG: ParB N-terminal domain-containing protein [Candidatus Dormibacteria bacterium]
MSEPSEAEGSPSDQNRLALRAGPLARWLAPTSQSRLERIPCSDIDTRPWPDPPGGDLLALTRSIRHRGIVEPLLLRPVDGARFQVVLGARRLEVARRLGLTDVPAIVRELEEAEATLISVWNALPRLQPGQMIEVAARLIAAGVTEAEIALLLATGDPETLPGPPRDWPLRAGTVPLRFSGSLTPVHQLLNALGSERRPALSALHGVDPARLAGPV